MTATITPRVPATLYRKDADPLYADLFATAPPPARQPAAPLIGCHVCERRAAASALAHICAECAADPAATLAHIVDLLVGLQQQVDTAQERYQALWDARSATTGSRYDAVQAARTTLPPAAFQRRLRATLERGDELAALLLAEQAATATHRLWPRLWALWAARVALGWQEVAQ